MDEEELYQIETKLTCAGIVIREGKVIKAAPIFGWMMNHHINYIQRYCQEKNFNLSLVESHLERSEKCPKELG